MKEISDDQCTILTLGGQVTDLEMHCAKLQQKLERAAKAVDPLDASVLRSILNNWRGSDSLVLASPDGLANQLLCVLDALAIVQGTEEECRRVDAMLERVFGVGSRRP